MAAEPPALRLVLSALDEAVFADRVLADPELASCLALAPTLAAAARAPRALPDAAALEALLARQLAAAALVAPRLAVTFAEAEIPGPVAVAYGESALLVAPLQPAPALDALARAAASALLAARARPAAPVAGVAEPLLALGEALALAGSHSLVALPAALLPVKDWLEAKNAAASLAALADAALDEKTGWPARRARLVRTAAPHGATPDVAHAAAFLLEAFGDPERARREPLALLRAWAAGDKEMPRAPVSVRRALSAAADAGMPRKPEEREPIALSAYERALDSGLLPTPAPEPGYPAGTRLRAVARARAEGREAACGWLGEGIPATLRTGCRAEGERAGLVYSRPLAGGGSEVVARALTGEEASLLIWPRWTLFPQVVEEQNELVFVDPEGIWAVSLDAGVAPRRLADGSYRHLVAGPAGRVLVAARWPAGTLTRIGGTDLSVSASGGIAFLEDDVLAVASATGLSLVSLDGAHRPSRAPLACARSLALRGGRILAAVGPPCDAGVVSASPVEEATSRLLPLAGAPLTVVPLPDGALAFTTSEGLWRWAGGDQLQRIGIALTAGPG